MILENMPYPRNFILLIQNFLHIAVFTIQHTNEIIVCAYLSIFAYNSPRNKLAAMFLWCRKYISQNTGIYHSKYHDMTKKVFQQKQITDGETDYAKEEWRGIGRPKSEK